MKSEEDFITEVAEVKLKNTEVIEVVEREKEASAKLEN